MATRIDLKLDLPEAAWTRLMRHPKLRRAVDHRNETMFSIYYDTRRLALRRNGTPIDQVSDLNGLVKSKPGMALGLLILIFSVAGIPPAAGFWGKLQVFTAGIEGGMLWLVLVGALASVVSLGYYLRLVWAMFVKPAGEPLDKTDMSVAATVAITTLLVFPVLTITIQFLLDAAARAVGG